MSGDASVGQVKDSSSAPSDYTSGDNLNAARLPVGGVQENTLAAANTAAQHLPSISIDNGAPYNPYQIAGTYDPNAIQFAKAKGFNTEEINVLEEGGPARFNQTMQWLNTRPDMIQGTKNFADGVGYEQTHPNVPFNPMNVPGTYNQADIQFAQANHFSSDQIHVMEQWGPNNFNQTMEYLKQNPGKIQDTQNLANVVGYWETHPDMPANPGATTNTYKPEDVQFAQANGFNANQMKVLTEFGADNFNNTMDYIKQNPSSLQNFKDLADAVGSWQANMTAATPRTPATPPGAQGKR
jgi:hypothetical protein